MPWKTVLPMQERMKFIAAVDNQDVSFAELCRGFGISRKTGYKWLDRYEEEGPGGLEARGNAAHANAKALSEDQVDAVVDLRREHPTWGPKKLRARLESLGSCTPLPARSTIGAVLKRYGLVRPRRRRAHGPRELTGLTLGERPNDVWCVDFKGDFKLGDRTRCYPLTMTDFESRYLLACTALSSTKEVTARDVFERVFREFGLPEYIRSDNGVPFSSVAIGGLTTLCIWWIKLGIIPERIEPAHPEQNGRHERMHRTLKAEATRPARYDQVGQQRAFDLFRHEYNDVRPHEALGLRTPASRYAVSRRTMPNELQTPSYPETMTTRRIDSSGRLKVYGHQVLLTKALAHECVGLEDLENGSSDIYFGPLRLGAVGTQGKDLVLNCGPARRIRAAVTL
jgi:transposase InsO family protein